MDLSHLFRIHPPVCLIYHVCSSCSYSMGRGSWHVKTDVGRRADLPQCKASGLLKTLPNRAFVNCWKEEPQRSFRLQLVNIVGRVSPICAFSLFLCCLHIMLSQLNMQLHHGLAQGTDLTENSPTERRKKRGKNLFQSAQISDLIYHTAALTFVPPPGR